MFLRDLALVALAFLVSLAVGILANRFRSDPLSFPHRDRAFREKEAGAKEPAVVAMAEAGAAWRNGVALFIDAREADFFEEGHIPGAVNLSVAAIKSTVPAGVPLDRPLIVYCSGGDCEDSGVVARALLKMGCRDVAVFAGGWEEWSAAGISR
jgi:rhodanese-related sulfurtransferase